jgi:co-chaperonin GroES (HSP10)
MKTKKNLIIVGDRVLIDPDERMDKTASGLYLPPTVKEKEKVMAGQVVKTGRDIHCRTRRRTSPGEREKRT